MFIIQCKAPMYCHSTSYIYIIYIGILLIEFLLFLAENFTTTAIYLFFYLIECVKLQIFLLVTKCKLYRKSLFFFEHYLAYFSWFIILFLSRFQEKKINQQLINAIWPSYFIRNTIILT